MAGKGRRRAAAMCVMAGVGLLGLAAFGPSADAAPVALSGWTVQGGAANWQVQPAGNVVKVVPPAQDFPHSNGSPSMFVSPANVGGTFKINIEPLDEADDDYVGFALGYRAPIDDASCQSTNSCSTDFFLVDWKRAQEQENGAATTDGHEGFSLMRVLSKHDMKNNNTPDHINCFWTHQTVQDACVVMDTDYGAGKGYAFGVTYTFQVTYTPNLLKVVLLGSGGNPDTEIFNVATTGNQQFQTGRLAFYNYSQPNVEYALDDGTTPPSTTSSSTTAPTSTSTTAAAAVSTTTRATVGPAVSSTIVRTGQSATATTVELLAGFSLLVVGAVMSAARGRRAEGTHFA